MHQARELIRKWSERVPKINVIQTTSLRNALSLVDVVLNVKNGMDTMDDDELGNELQKFWSLLKP